MSDDHINGGGFTSPSKAERLEHAEISSVHGKKVFNIDSSGNLVNPANSDNQTNGSQKTQVVETIPTDTTKLNASTLVSFNASGEAIYVDKTIGANTFRKEITRTDMVVASTLPITNWSET